MKSAFGLQKAAGEIADGIPDGQEAYDEDGDEDKDDILGVDADRVGIDDEGTAAGAEGYETEALLEPAEQEA